MGNIETWAQFGLGGIVIFALFVLVLILLKEIKSGRSEFLSCLEKMTSVYDVRQKETNEAIGALSLVIERNTRGYRDKG